jgi:hypothetical protein
MPVYGLDIVVGLLPRALSANYRRKMPFSGQLRFPMFPTPLGAVGPPCPFSRVLFRFRRSQMLQGQC